jgi:3-dehydroquinate synthase
LPRWLELMGRDKKVESGLIRFILLERLGRAVIRAGVPGTASAASVAP